MIHKRELFIQEFLSLFFSDLFLEKKNGKMGRWEKSRIRFIGTPLPIIILLFYFSSFSLFLFLLLREKILCSSTDRMLRLHIFIDVS